MEYLFTGLRYANDELIVVNYHSTPADLIPELKKQLDFFRRKFNVITPAQLDEYYSGKFKSEKPPLLITFDDGLKNNVHAAKALDELGLKAFFFIVPAFMECPASEQKAYYIKNIRPVINSNIDKREEDFRAMTEADVRGLIQSGHAIGSHTYTHVLVAANSDEANSEKEITGSKNFLETKFGRVISYCSINNTLESTGSKEKKLIGANYTYHFTTIPALNAPDKNPLFIRRRNIECFWMTGAMYYALGKWDLGRWKAAEATFRRL